jgi:hypothetical protein
MQAIHTARTEGIGLLVMVPASSTADVVLLAFFFTGSYAGFVGAFFSGAAWAVDIDLVNTGAGGGRAFLWSSSALSSAVNVAESASFTAACSSTFLRVSMLDLLQFKELALNDRYLFLEGIDRWWLF